MAERLSRRCIVSHIERKGAREMLGICVRRTSCRLEGWG